MVPHRVPAAEAATHGQGTGQEGTACRPDIPHSVAPAPDPEPHQVCCVLSKVVGNIGCIWLFRSPKFISLKGF